MPIKILKQKKLTWINIPEMNAESLAYLEKNYDFHELDLEDIQEETQTPKLDVYKQYLFIVMQFPIHHETTQKVSLHEMAMFLGDNYLITVQRGKSKAMKQFFEKLIKNEEKSGDWMEGSSGFLLYNLLEAMFHNTQPILTRLGKELNLVEEEIFEGDQSSDNIRELAMHRRDILTFRRILDPQRYLISTLTHIRKPFMDKDMALYIDDIHDYLNKLWAIVNSYKDTVNGLHITVESLINQRTNKVIGMLTVVSAALLPLTLLAGIYGMNVPLPFANNPNMVWGIFCGLGIIIVTMIVLLKKKRWI